MVHHHGQCIKGGSFDKRVYFNERWCIDEKNKIVDAFTSASGEKGIFKREAQFLDAGNDDVAEVGILALVEKNGNQPEAEVTSPSKCLTCFDQCDNGGMEKIEMF